MDNAARKKSTWINITFKYLQLAVSIVSGVVLVPVYLRYLSIDQYGAWLTVGSIVVWLTAFDPGLANLLIQRIGHSSGAGDARAVRGYVYAGIACGLMVALTVALCGNLVAQKAIAFLGIAEQSSSLLTEALRIAAVTTGVMLLGYSLTAALLGLQKSLSVGVVFLFAPAVKVTAVLILLSKNVGLLALPYAELASAIWVVVAGGGILVASLRHYVTGGKRIGLERLRELAGLFVFSLGARLCKIVTRNLDNVFISRALGAEMVVLYNLTGTAPRHSENLLNLPIAALRPAISHLAGSKDLDRLQYYVYRLLRYVLWGTGLTFSGLLALNDDFVRLWVGKGCFAGADVAFALILVFFVRVWGHATGTINFCLGDIRKNSLVEWGSSLLLVPATILGVKYGGLFGVGVAHVAVAAVTTMWYFPWSLSKQIRFSRAEKLSLFIEGGIVTLCVTGSFLAVGAANPQNWPEFSLASLALTAIYLFLLMVASSTARAEFMACGKWIKAQARLEV